MNYINVGAFVNGVRPKTKKALREAVRDIPQAVIFDATDMWHEGHRYGVDHTIANQDDTLQVCGPDPYRTRNWYASVKNGKVT